MARKKRLMARETRADLARSALAAAPVFLADVLVVIAVNALSMVLDLSALVVVLILCGLRNYGGLGFLQPVAFSSCVCGRPQVMVGWCLRLNVTDVFVTDS